MSPAVPAGAVPLRRGCPREGCRDGGTQCFSREGAAAQMPLPAGKLLLLPPRITAESRREPRAVPFPINIPGAVFLKEVSI